MKGVKSAARAAGAFAVAAALVAALTSAQATSGTDYDGTDPASTGCVNSGRVIFARDLYDPSDTYGGTVQILYSSACGTNWVRTYEPYNSITRNAQGGLPQFTENEQDPGQGWTYSMQVYAPGSHVSSNESRRFPGSSTAATHGSRTR
ncbi:DUF2690 domain-containing protein [Aeromicrobium sp. CFBP 8757]|uniref:DUF2690 domain-containing protein n=1 Tax=Aeromicrobium sp. CFBP 8757 TaxID=2775288 RepID=UPI0035300B15